MNYLSLEFRITFAAIKNRILQKKVVRKTSAQIIKSQPKPNHKYSGQKYHYNSEHSQFDKEIISNQKEFVRLSIKKLI